MSARAKTKSEAGSRATRGPGGRPQPFAHAEGRPQPFAHAEDLAPAYRELSAALQALEKDPPLRFVPNPREVPMLSTRALLRTASELQFWADLLGSAARRVHVAKYGEPEAARYVAQLARERAGRREAEAGDARWPFVHAATVHTGPEEGRRREDGKSGRPRERKGPARAS